MMRLDEFRASSRFVPDHEVEGGYKGPCLVYAHGLTIDLCIDHPEGPFMLNLGNESRVSFDLLSLEIELYLFACAEGYL